MEHWTYNSGTQFARRLFRRQLTKSHRTTARLVAMGHEFPPQRRIPPKRSGVWAISMVKNEADIVKSFVRHLFGQGVEGLVIADNGSTDGTLEILQELAADYPIVLGRDREVGYYQAHKMSRLAAIARKAGALWIVPMDADEFWFGEGGTIAQFLDQCPAAGAVASLHNVFPTHETPTLDGLSGRLRIDCRPGPLGKAAARSFPGMWVGMGNHQIDRPGEVVTGLHLLHIPWRSEEQFRRKNFQGAEALNATTLPEELGGHWRRQALLSESETSERWRQLLSGSVGQPMDWSPSEDTKVVQGDDWRDWREVLAAIRTGR